MKWKTEIKSKDPIELSIIAQTSISLKRTAFRSTEKKRWVDVLRSKEQLALEGGTQRLSSGDRPSGLDP